jgi:hypothetical protein
MIAASGQNGSAASCQNRARRPPGCSCRAGKKLSTDIATARVIGRIETLEEIDLGRVLRFQSAYALRIGDASGSGLALEGTKHARALPQSRPADERRSHRQHGAAISTGRASQHRNGSSGATRPNGLDQQHMAHAPLG